LRKAGVAAAAEHFFEPANDSALHYIEQAEAEAKRLGTASGGAQLLRRLYGNQFRSLGNALLEAKLNDLAAVRFAEALRFLPGDADLRMKVGVANEARGGADKAQDSTSTGTGTNRRPVDEPARVAADLFSSAASGRFSQARVALARLTEVDKEGRQTARLADEFRRRAHGMWEKGKHDEARPYYQLVAELDPKDLVARDRASGKEEPVVAAPPTPPPPPEPEPKQGRKRTASSDEPAMDDSRPRDRSASAKAAVEGARLLARGDLAQAQAAFDRAVRADASNPDAVAGRGEVAFENARYTEALDYGRRAVRLQGKSAKYHVLVGDAYFKLLRYDEALAAYQRAETLSPKDEGIKARIGRVRARFGGR
jgi:tetratricopeptide (TPR) repeat protein